MFSTPNILVNSVMSFCSLLNVSNALFMSKTPSLYPIPAFCSLSIMFLKFRPAVVGSFIFGASVSIAPTNPSNDPPASAHTVPDFSIAELRKEISPAPSLLPAAKTFINLVASSEGASN